MAELKRYELEDSDSLKVVANVWDDCHKKVYRAEVDFLNEVDADSIGAIKDIVPCAYRDYPEICITAWSNGEEIAKVKTGASDYDSLVGSIATKVASQHGISMRRRR